MESVSKYVEVPPTGVAVIGACTAAMFRQFMIASVDIRVVIDHPLHPSFTIYTLEDVFLKVNAQVGRVGPFRGHLIRWPLPQSQ